MKIAMLGLKGVPFPAGIENFTEQIGWRLVERGHEVTVYSRPYVEVGEDYRGLRIRRLPSIDSKHLDALTHTAVGSLDVLLRDVDVVHYHALGPSVFSMLPRLRGMRTVAHVHGLDWQREKWGRFASACLRAAEYAVVYFPNRTVTISRGLKDYFERRYRREVDYVPTGVNEYATRPPDEIRRWGLDSGSYLLFLGRLVPEKGCHYLLEAFEAIETDKRLVIAGPTSHSEAYGARLRRSESERVLFTGAVTGKLLEELFSNAYAYVLPSEMEGLPHSLLQALSFGKCVLASDIDANVEAMGECGITFRSRDSKDLEEKLRYLLANPEATARLAEHARARVKQNYSWDTVVDALEGVYERCMRTGR